VPLDVAARRLVVLLLPLRCSPPVIVFGVSLFFFYICSPSAPLLLFLAASLHPLCGICAVSACSAAFGIIRFGLCHVGGYSALYRVPSYTCFVSHLPLVSIVVDPAVCCLFSLSFSFCVLHEILLSVPVLFSPPSVGLATLVVFFSVCLCIAVVCY